jgi:glutathione S-transferase
MKDIVLYGFDGSTYVRTVRMVLAEKGLEYSRVPLNVMKGEARSAEHLERHPFGKVPVLEIDGFRIRETDAICRYLDDTFPGPVLQPQAPEDRARMNEAISLINSYGYPAMIGVAGYHLFPAFLGGRDEKQLSANLESADRLLELLMENRGSRRWLAGDKRTLADMLLAPLVDYVSLTRERGRIESVAGMESWWQQVTGLESFRITRPDLG